jgi:HSP20 family protein
MLAIEKFRPLTVEPFEPFRLFNQMNRFFTEPFEPVREPYFLKDWMPNLDMVETKDEVIVKTDLPGIRKTDIELKVVNNELLIKGERKEEKEFKADEFTRRERFHGFFHRKVELPEGVNADQIKATFTDGVLEVRFPRPMETKTKVIKIN